jgi:DNA-binding response OmpR family regulator
VSRVLVIDDEPKIVSFVSRALTARGYDVDSAGNGAHGLDLVRMGGYAVVVLDLRLPDIDGIDVLRTTLEERPDQQVIVLSALPDVDTKVQCLDLGAADYIT